MERDVRVCIQPCPDLGGVVGGQIVQNDVDLSTGMGFHGPFDEGQELGGAAPRVAVGEDLTSAGVQRGEQIRGAVPAVAVGAFLGKAEVERQQRLGPIEGLDLGFLIDRQHDRAAGRVQVQADRVGDLLGDRRILLQFERALPRGLQPVVPPQPRHVMPGHGDTLAAFDVGGHLPARPVRQPRPGRR